MKFCKIHNEIRGAGSCVIRVYVPSPFPGKGSWGVDNSLPELKFVQIILANTPKYFRRESTNKSLIQKTLNSKG